MPHHSGFSCSLVAVLTILPATLFAATDIQVAPAGNESSLGTVTKAVATNGVLKTSTFTRKLAGGTPQRIVLFGTSLTAEGAWVAQMQSVVDSAYPGLATWINSGGLGKASDWGVTNLQTKVIDQNPDVVFIEFSVNDAAVVLNVSRAQALANLATIVNGIRAARPNCQIILQVMNPVDRRDTDTYSPRPNLAQYQQDYRNFAASNGLQCIDHMPAFQALLDEGSDSYRLYVPDGLHPSTEGFARYLTPVLLQAIGLAPTSTDVRLRMDNGRAAEPSAPQAAARDSTLIVWRGGSTTNALTVQLDFAGGSAASGSDYAALPTSITIPAGQVSAAIQLLPLYDQLVEGDETFRASLVPAAGYSNGYPYKASIVIEDYAGNANTPPVASNVVITGTAAIGTTLVGSYSYSDAENDSESGSLLQWFRSNDGALGGGDPAIVGATNSSYIVRPEDSGKTLFFLVTPRTATGAPAGNSAASGGVSIPAAPSGSFKILIQENFGSPGAALNGTAADTFDAALTSAGGSSTWGAAASFLVDGTVSLATRQAACLNLGNYINSAKGAAAGALRGRPLCESMGQGSVRPRP